MGRPRSCSWLHPSTLQCSPNSLQNPGCGGDTLGPPEAALMTTPTTTTFAWYGTRPTAKDHSGHVEHIMSDRVMGAHLPCHQSPPRLGTLCSGLGILSNGCQATVLWNLAWRLPQQSPRKSAALPPGHYPTPAALWFILALPASLNSFYYLIHRITILIPKVDLN